MGNLDTSAARGKPQAGGQKCRWGRQGAKKTSRLLLADIVKPIFASNFNFMFETEFFTVVGSIAALCLAFKSYYELKKQNTKNIYLLDHRFI